MDIDVFSLRFILYFDGLKLATQCDTLLLGLVLLDLDHFINCLLKVELLQDLTKLLSSDLSNAEHIFYVKQKQLR